MQNTLALTLLATLAALALSAPDHPAGRLGHPDRLARRLGSAVHPVGHLDSAGHASVRRRSYLLAYAYEQGINTRRLPPSVPPLPK